LLDEPAIQELTDPGAVPVRLLGQVITLLLAGRPGAA
jgi:hypothetical protein